MCVMPLLYSAAFIFNPSRVIFRRAVMMVAGLLCFSWVGTNAQVTFTGFGAGTGRWADLSNDGSLVIGLGTDQDTANFRWTRSTGTTPLEHVPAYVPIRIAVSGDGNAITGTDGDLHHAFHSGGSGGIEDIGTLAGRKWSSSTDISADGNTIVGSATNSGAGGLPSSEAFRWTQADGMSGLGTLGGKMSDAYGVSADGSIVAGASTLADGEGRAFRWTQNEGMILLGSLGVESGAMGISDNGSVILGFFEHPGFEDVEAFRWTAGTGMVGLGHVVGNDNSIALGASNDGSMIICETAGGGFVWTPHSGMRDLLDVLNRDYGISGQTRGWDWLKPLAITPDGRYITGIGDQGGWLLDRGSNPPGIDLLPVLSPVPEPSFYGLAGSVVLMGVAGWRRRQRRAAQAAF